MKCVMFYGYIVYENGDIFTKRGKKILDKDIPVKSKNASYIARNRFIYGAFHRDFDIADKHFCIKRDESRSGNYINTLVKLQRGEYYKNTILTPQKQEEVINVYNNAKKNGRKITYRQLAKKYGVSHTRIAQIIKRV